jgi:Zn-dependent peptidase ImmA (M78 family)
MSSEWQANTFAAHFLMPDYIVRQFLSALDLAQCCQVSMQAAQNRFEELGLHKRKRELPPEVLEYLIAKGRRTR